MTGQNGNGGNGSAGTNIAYVAGTVHANYGLKEIGESQAKKTELTVSAPNGRGGSTPVYVEAWGAMADAAAAIERGTRVQIAGEIRTDEWGPDDAQNRKLMVNVEETEGHEIAVADGDDINQAHVHGEVAWAGDLEEITWKSKTDGEPRRLDKRRLFVAVEKTSPTGKSIRPTVPIEILGDAAAKDYPTGTRVEVSGLVINEMVPGGDGEGDKNRYFATVSVSGEGTSISAV